METLESTSHEDLSTASTSSTAKSSLIPILSTRRYSRTHNSEVRLSTEKIIYTFKRSSKQKQNLSEVEASTSQESLTISNSTKDSYKHKLRNSKTKTEFEETKDKSITESNHQEITRKKSSEKYWKRSNRSLNSPDNSTTDSSKVNQEVKHKYPLRNRLSTSSTIAPNNRVSSTQEKNKRKSVALGATTSHQAATREEQEPSRLTRSGAVLRRSTRNSKGEFIIKKYMRPDH